MSTLSIGLALAIRIALVLLFLPFSALDKVLDFRGAVAQAHAIGWRHFPQDRPGILRWNAGR